MRAAGEDGDAPFCVALPGMDARRGHRRGGGDRGRRKLQHRAERLQRRDLFEQADERLAQLRQLQRGAKARGIGQHEGQHGARQPVEQRPLVGLLDMGAGMVDQMHVVDARRAGGHAGEAGQAAVDMGDDLLVGRAAVLQHVLDQVDAPARRIELVAQRHIGRAGGGAEAAMHAFAQDLLRFRDMRIGELGKGEIGLHAKMSYNPRNQLSGFLTGSPRCRACKPRMQRAMNQTATANISTKPITRTSAPPRSAHRAGRSRRCGSGRCSGSRRSRRTCRG